MDVTNRYPHTKKHKLGGRGMHGNPTLHFETTVLDRFNHVVIHKLVVNNTIDR